MRKFVLAAAAASLTVSWHAHAADRIKIGLMTQLSGPISPSGTELKRGFDLAMEELGGKIGGLPAKATVVDDKSDPAEAVQAASKLIDDQEVDVVTGLGSSNTLTPTFHAFVDANLTLVGALAGPAAFAGKECSANAFFVSFQNDDLPMAMAKYMNEHGVKKAMFVAADYQAGVEHVSAAMRSFKGEKVGPLMTPLTELDFSAELARVRAAHPDGMFAFEVGPGAVAFVKQYAQAGLKPEIPFYTEFLMANPLTFEAQGAAVEGTTLATSWNADLDNPANKAFVAGFRKKFGRTPAAFAAYQYDAIKLLDSAVRAVHGHIEDKTAFRAAIRAADFKSVRGPFKFNNNQFPIQNFYIEKVVKDPDGTLRSALVERAAADWQDAYHQDCGLK